MLKGKGTISDFQKKVIIRLGNLPDLSYFYLTGGTALAEFYLAHRKSYDLDIFTKEENLLLPFSRIVEKELKNFYSVSIIRRFSTFSEFEVSREDKAVRVQLALDSVFHLEESIDSNLGIKVNSYKDIIADKLLAFFGRAEPRDAIDLFFILKREDFWKLAALAAQKDAGFDLYWLAVALEKVKDFPEQIERWPVEMIARVEVKELKKKFASLSLEIMKRLKKG